MIGIIQGRLTKAPKNRLQYFPGDWQKEFFLANQCGYEYIEFFSERKFNDNNPIWSNKNIQTYKKLAKINGLKIYSFVDDYIISNSVYQEKNVKYINKLIKNLKKLGIKKLILPMYGKSNINEKNFSKFIKPLQKICNLSYKNKIQVLLEGNFRAKLYFNLKKKIKCNNLYLVFDTGNRINLKRNMYYDMQLFKKHIKHIHIKDKNDLKKNVRLRDGNVDFNLLFKTLKKIRYKGNFTVESTRGDNPILTAKKNLNFIKKKLFFLQS